MVILLYAFGSSICTFIFVHILWINNGYRWFKAVKEIQEKEIKEKNNE